MIKSRIVGACKSCCNNIYFNNAEEYEHYVCSHCGEINHTSELVPPVMFSAFMLAKEDAYNMMEAGDVLARVLGFHSQALKAVEEASEFNQALLKYDRCKNEENLANVYEEYFDMLATSTQIIRLLVRNQGDGTKNILKAVAKKLTKLEEYADMASNFTSPNHKAIELEEFQSHVEKERLSRHG